MSTLPKGPERSFAVEEANAWLLAAQERWAQLHLQAAGPWNSEQRHAAFADMSALLLESFEEVRVLSAQLREDSQATRTKATELLEHSARLVERSTKAIAAGPEFARPPAEDIQEAERHLLDCFRRGEGQRQS